MQPKHVKNCACDKNGKDPDCYRRETPLEKHVKRLEKIIHDAMKHEYEGRFEVKVYLWSAQAMATIGPRISEISTIVRKGTSVGGVAMGRYDFNCSGIILAAEDILLNLIFEEPVEELNTSIEKLKYNLNPKA